MKIADIRTLRLNEYSTYERKFDAITIGKP